MHEGLALTPKIAFYNVGNFSNFSTGTGTLQNTTTAGGTYNSGSGGAGFFTGPNAFALCLGTSHLPRCGYLLAGRSPSD